MEVSLYPFEYMRITQRHDEGNHLPHWNPTPHPLYTDKPWDEACKNGGRSYFTPFNDYRVVEKMGTQKSGYSVRLESVNLLKTPYQKDPLRLELTLTHMNKDSMDKIKEGDILKKGTKILMEGNSGQASGYHFHCTVNIGLYDGFRKNSNNKYVFAYQKSLLPDEAFYVDTNKTEILNSKKYNFIGVNYKKGMRNQEIANIDDFLATKIRGDVYGEYTEESVKVFQKKENLRVTNGEVDLETFERLLDRGAKL